MTNVNETADSTINTNSPTTELTTASNRNTEKTLPNISHIYIHLIGNVSGIGNDDLSSDSDSANSSNSDDDDHHNDSAASSADSGADSGADEDSGNDSAGVNSSSGNQSGSGSSTP